MTVSEALPDYENGNSHARMINLQNPAVLPGLTNAARAIKRHGAIANIKPDIVRGATFRGYHAALDL